MLLPFYNSFLRLTRECRIEKNSHNITVTIHTTRGENERKIHRVYENKNTLQAPQIDVAPKRKAKQHFQLIFKFNVFFFVLSCRCRPTLLHRRGHPKQVAGESVNLLSKKPKKRVWKVKAAPENDEDEEEDIKEVG